MILKTYTNIVHGIILYWNSKNEKKRFTQKMTIWIYNTEKCQTGKYTICLFVDLIKILAFAKETTVLWECDEYRYFKDLTQKPILWTQITHSFYNRLVTNRKVNLEATWAIQFTTKSS